MATTTPRPYFRLPLRPVVMAEIPNLDPDPVRIVSIDLGTKKTTAAMLCAIHEPGYCVHVVADLDFEKPSTRYMQRALQRSGQPWPHMVAFGKDANTDSLTSGSSVAAEWRKAGYAVTTLRHRVDAGLRCIQAMLNDDAALIRLTIDPDCVQLLDALKRVSYSRGRNGVMKCLNPTLAHRIDALRYAIAAIPQALRERQQRQLRRAYANPRERTAGAHFDEYA